MSLMTIALVLTALLSLVHARRRDDDIDFTVRPTTAAPTTAAPATTAAPTSAPTAAPGGATTTALGSGVTLTDNLQLPEPCRDTFGNVCGFAPGQVFVGQYSATARAPTQSGQPFALTIGAHNFAILSSQGANGVDAVFERWVATDDFVTVVDLGASSAGLQCATTQFAKYAVKWSKQCNELSLQQRIDPCSHRGGLLRGAINATTGSAAPITLYLQPCHATAANCGLVVNGGGFLGSLKYADSGEVATLSIGQTFGGEQPGIIWSEQRGADFVVLSLKSGTLRQVGGQYVPATAACDATAATPVVVTPRMSNGVCAGFTIAVNASTAQCADVARRFGSGVTMQIAGNCPLPPLPTTAAATTQAPPATRRPHAHFARGDVDLFEIAGVRLDRSHYDAELAREGRAAPRRRDD